MFQENQGYNKQPQSALYLGFGAFRTVAIDFSKLYFSSRRQKISISNDADRLLSPANEWKKSNVRLRKRKLKVNSRACELTNNSIYTVVFSVFLFWFWQHLSVDTGNNRYSPPLHACYFDPIKSSATKVLMSLVTPWNISRRFISASIFSTYLSLNAELMGSWCWKWWAYIHRLTSGGDTSIREGIFLFPLLSSEMTSKSKSWEKFRQCLNPVYVCVTV